MLISEIFDKPLEWKSAYTGRYTFNVGDDEYSVTISQEVYPDNLKYAEEKPDDINILRQKFESQIGSERRPIIEVLFIKEGVGSSAIDILGGAESFKIFSTVIDIIKNHINTHPKVQGLFFTAKEPSRRKLYTRMIKYFSKNINTKYYIITSKKHEYYMILL